MGTTKKSGENQAKKPRKLLTNGLDPSIGKKTQWKKGQSGNPAGPKPGFKHINTWIQELVSDESFEARIVDPKLGVMDYKGAPMKAILKSLAHISLSHPEYNVRLKAMDMLMKYGWPTKNEHSGIDGEPLIPVVRIIDERPSA